MNRKILAEIRVLEYLTGEVNNKNFPMTKEEVDSFYFHIEEIDVVNNQNRSVLKLMPPEISERLSQYPNISAKIDSIIDENI